MNPKRCAMNDENRQSDFIESENVNKKGRKTLFTQSH